MAINKPIIDSGPTQSRAEAKMVVGRIALVAPPEPYVAKVNGQLTGFSNDAEREGQFVFVKPDGALSVSMYIVIQGPTELEWKRVYSAGLITDPRAGKAKDPLFDLY